MKPWPRPPGPSNGTPFWPLGSSGTTSGRWARWPPPASWRWDTRSASVDSQSTPQRGGCGLPCHVAAVDHLAGRRAHRRRPRRCRLVIIPLHGARQRLLHPPPMALLEAVKAVDRGRGPSVDPAVERLVAPSRLLLPRPAREAFDDPGPQPLGRELPKILLAVLREVAGPGRIACPGIQRFFGRPLQLEPAVQLALRDRRANRPHPQPAPLAAGIGLRRRQEQRGVSVAALHRDRSARLPRRGAGRPPAGLRMLPDPGVHILGGVAGVHAHHPDRERLAACVRPVPDEDTIQLRPDLGPSGIALDHVVVDRPALLASAPGDHLDLDPVLLHVDPGGNEEARVGHHTDAVILAPLVQPLPLGRLGLLLERQPQHRVDEPLHEVGRLLRLLIHLGGIGPAEPPGRAVEAGEVEPPVRASPSAVGRHSPCSSIQVLCRSPISAPQWAQAYSTSRGRPSGQRRFSSSSVWCSWQCGQGTKYRRWSLASYSRWIRDRLLVFGVETRRILRRWKVAERRSASRMGSPSPSTSPG